MAMRPHLCCMGNCIWCYPNFSSSQTIKLCLGFGLGKTVLMDKRSIRHGTSLSRNRYYFWAQVWSLCAIRWVTLTVSRSVCEEVTVSSGGPCVAGAAVTWEVNNFCWKQGSGISPISSGSVGWSIGQVELLTWGPSFRMRGHFKQHSGWGRRWELLQECFYSKCVCTT